MNDVTGMESGGCGGSDPFALQVLDDTMEPEFAKGCIIIIDPSGVVTNGSFVLAEVDGELIFRQLIVVDDRYYLKTMQAGCESIEVSGLGAVKGVVVQRAGTRRRYHKHYV
ncbi:MAG: S24 family peptidase [Pseudomonadota bacterium]|nr:MAG: S24 family peptidase [Pseudomonadota bacterium]